MKLAKEAAEKIEDLALSMRRVMLSTDRPLDFYILCARDTEMIGAEYVMAGYTMDIKRVLLLDISRGQYLSRLQRDFRLNPVVVGESKIRSLFKDLSEKASPELVLLNYVHFPISTQKVQEIFYPTILIAEPQSINYEIIDIKTKEISENEALFWVKTKETYTPRPSAQRGASIFPPGFTNEYLILVNRAIQTRPIAEILPKFFPKENEIQQRFIGEIFAKYEDASILDSDGLPIKEIKLADFLAKQVARRLKERLEFEEPFREKFQVAFIVVRFEDGIFKLDFNIEGEEKEIFTQALSVFRDIIREYRFEDFDGIEIKSDISGTKISISKEELENFRHKNIALDEFL